MTDHSPDGRPITGRTVLLIAVSAFGVVIAANMALVVAATGSFPGLIVKNSYVASQDWDARTEAQRALGWQARVGHAGGRLAVRIEADGAPVTGLAVAALVGRPATDAEDRRIALVETAGSYAAPVDLDPGLWRVALEATDGEGRRFDATASLNISALAGGRAEAR